jgi:heat shock protein HslJ
MTPMKITLSKRSMRYRIKPGICGVTAIARDDLHYIIRKEILYKCKTSAGLLLSGFLVLMIASCIAKAPSTESKLEKLRASTWRWVRFTDPLQQFDVAGPEKYSLTFTPDGGIYIKADCNRAKGSYKADEQGSLSIEIGPMTRAMCTKDSRSDQFVKYLGFVRHYFLKDGHVFFDLFADGGTMEFTPVANEIDADVVK